MLLEAKLGRRDDPIDDRHQAGGASAMPTALDGMDLRQRLTAARCAVVVRPAWRGVSAASSASNGLATSEPSAPSPFRDGTVNGLGADHSRCAVVTKRWCRRAGNDVVAAEGAEAVRGQCPAGQLRNDAPAAAWHVAGNGQFMVRMS